MKYMLITLPCIVLVACSTTGLRYQDVYDRYRTQGMTMTEAITAADAYCLNNPCIWGK